MIGNKYVKLTVVKEIEERAKNGNIQYLCKCDCGNEKVVTRNSLVLGNTKSCGCIKRGRKK